MIKEKTNSTITSTTPTSPIVTNGGKKLLLKTNPFPQKKKKDEPSSLFKWIHPQQHQSTAPKKRMEALLASLIQKKQELRNHVIN